MQGVHFVNASYYLEGDGPLIFSCYERLSAVSHAVAVDHYPNTSAVARETVVGDAALYSQLILQAKACIKPGLQFYQQKFSGQFHAIVRAFKAARLSCPVQVQSLKPTAESLEESELPLYQRRHEDSKPGRRASRISCSSWWCHSHL